MMMGNAIATSVLKKGLMLKNAFSMQLKTFEFSCVQKNCVAQAKRHIISENLF